MDIYNLIKTDHEIMRDIFFAMEKTDDTDMRKDLFSLLRTDLIVHSKAEEEALYRPLREKAGDHPLIKNSFDDHHEMEHMLMDIQTSSAKKEAWMEKISQLRNTVTQHMEREETELFNLAQSNFSDAEAKNIGIHMMAEKGKIGMENPFMLVGRKIKEAVKG